MVTVHPRRQYRFEEVGQPVEADLDASRELVENWVQTFPTDVYWEIVPYTVFEERLDRRKDSSPGPDGIPIGLWQRAPMWIRETLYRSYLALLEGAPLPPPSFPLVSP